MGIEKVDGSQRSAELRLYATLKSVIDLEDTKLFVVAKNGILDSTKGLKFRSKVAKRPCDRQASRPNAQLSDRNLETNK